MKSDPRVWLCDLLPVLQKEGVVAEQECLSCRVEEKIYITPPFTAEKGLSLLKIDDILVVHEKSSSSGNEAPSSLALHKALYTARPEINALIHSRSPAVMASSRAGVTVFPLLDDMAQIVGTSIRTAPSGTEKIILGQSVRAFRGRNAFFIEDQGALCGGSSLDEAHAVSQVCEKACKAFIESSFIGGGHRINPLESWLMRAVYLKKYSRQSTENR